MTSGVNEGNRLNTLPRRQWIAWVMAIVSLHASEALAGQSRDGGQRWVRDNYLPVFDRALPIGDWTSDPATQGAEWRVGFRARGDGPEWLVVLVGGNDRTTANVVVAESPIEEQLLAQHIYRKGKLSAVGAKVNVRRWQLAGKGCEAVDRAVEWMLHQGVRLAQPSEFAMDGPTYDIKAEAVGRQVLVSSQGLGTDAQMVAVMRAVRNAAEAAQCTGK